jgi:hypothetical protein
MAGTREQIVRIIESCRRAPSGENCQPWSYQWDGQKLSIFHDPDRARNIINHAGYVSYFSLGFLFEMMQIGAGNEGLQAKFNWHPQKKASDNHWANVEFDEVSQATDDLFATFSKRFTDRRPFKGGSLNDEVFALVERDAERFKACNIYFKADPTDDFLAYACKAETFFWTNRPFHKDYTRWLRLRKREAIATKDGLPWKSLGVNYPISRVLLACKPYKVQTIVNKLGYVSLAKKLVKKQICSGAGVCCITIPASNVDNLVEAGRLGMRAWLRLNQHDYGFHPMSLSALITHYFVLGVADQIHPWLADLGREGEPVLREYFGYGANEIPIWIFRTGISAGFPKQHLTPRLDIDELLRFEAAY